VDQQQQEEEDGNLDRPFPVSTSWQHKKTTAVSTILPLPGKPNCRCWLLLLAAGSATPTAIIIIIISSSSSSRCVVAPQLQGAPANVWQMNRQQLLLYAHLLVNVALLPLLAHVEAGHGVATVPLHGSSNSFRDASSSSSTGGVALGSSQVPTGTMTTLVIVTVIFVVIIFLKISDVGWEVGLIICGTSRMTIQQQQQQQQQWAG
jgi:hypothetical protein